MRLSLFLYFFFGVFLNSYSQGCSAAIDTRTLPQLLYKNDEKIIVFSCKVLISEITQNGEGYSIAEIKEVYFGKTNLKKIKIYTGTFEVPPPPLYLRMPEKKEERKDYNLGYEISSKEGYISSGGSRYGGIKMPVDSTYIVYSRNDTSYFQNYMWFSKQLTNTPAVKNEIDMLRTFADIFKLKKSGNYIFKDYKNNVLAQGNYKKGNPIGDWKTFNEKGNLVSLESFKKNICKKYYLSGNVNSSVAKYKDSVVTETYLDKTKIQLSYKTVNVKIDSGYYEINSTFDKQGNIIDKRTSLAIYDKNGKDINGFGLNGLYQEYYPNGKIKLNAQYLLNRRVGCWKWYNADGTFMAEWDYLDGKAPQ